MSDRMTKREQREHEIDQLIIQAEKNLNHIAKRVQDIPYEMNLGTIKAVRNTVNRAMLDIDSLMDRDNARRAGK